MKEPGRTSQTSAKPLPCGVAWTLSDLAGHTVPGPDEVAEALGLRLQRAAV